MLRVLDLFCGAGGFSHGMERAGLNIIAGVDFDSDALATFRRNHPNAIAVEADMAALTPSSLGNYLGIYPGDIDVIIGGPPCQGFSKNRALHFDNHEFKDDERNGLYWHFYDFIDYFRPKYVVMENVPEILSVKNGHFKHEIQKRLENAGYYSEMNVLYANDFGVPQYRKRAFVMASLTEKIKFPLPTTKRGIRVGDRTPTSKATKNSKAASPLFDLSINADLMVGPSVWDAIGDLFGNYADSLTNTCTYHSAPSTPYQEILRGKNRLVANHYEWPLSENQLRRIKLLKEGQGMEHLPIEMQTKGGFGGAYRRMHSEAQALTLTTWLFHPGSGMFTHPKAHRIITIREAARLQSFSDSFIFTGSYHSQCRQVGNSVAPLVSESIGRSLVEHDQKLTSAMPLLSL